MQCPHDTLAVPVDEPVAVNKCHIHRIFSGE
jgi:hypothetical protein